VRSLQVLSEYVEAIEMEVTAIEATYRVTDSDELEKVLMNRVHGDVNQFWLNHEGGKYPHLGIAVKGELAYLYYVTGDRLAGLQSWGRLIGLDGDSTDFVIGEHDTISVQNEFVIPFAIAVDAAKQFLNDDAPPNMVEWYEL
jgi:hypothetical protein